MSDRNDEPFSDEELGLTTRRAAPDTLVEARVREYLAFSHTDGKCHIYGDDGELPCANLARHGRTIDFRREPIGDLLDIIIETRQREYATLRPVERGEEGA